MTIKINKLRQQQERIMMLERLLRHHGIQYWVPNENSYGQHIDFFLIGSDINNIHDVDVEV